MKSTLELLAPARDAEVAKAAILCGADAVYMGAPAFGARVSASNSVESIAETVNFAGRYGCRVYITMNTVLLDSELEDARKLVWQLYDAGVDALIVQDMAYLMMDLPPIALHASTQCDIRTPDKAKRLAMAGFSQLVLPREFTVDEVRACAAAAQVPVEVFIHGARCVSYSGDCQMGCAAGMGSGNRGNCPQMCRLPYQLLDSNGKAVLPGTQYYLSLSDLSTNEATLKALADAGARSFKIEGRLKDARYASNISAWYSQMLDRIVSASGGRYVRSSFGRSFPDFCPDPSQSFFRRPNGGGKAATLASPKDTGEPVGYTAAAKLRKGFKLKAALSNGDGLGFFSKDGFVGFRLNRKDGDICIAADTSIDIPAGTQIYRNFNKQFNDTLAAAHPTRTLSLNLELNVSGSQIRVNAIDETGRTATASEPIPAEGLAQAKKPQAEVRRNLFGRLGSTYYRLETYVDEIDNAFIPASVIGRLKSAVISALESQKIPGQKDLRRPDILRSDAFADLPPMTYHDNITNKLSEKFYLSHGAKILEQGLEARKKLPSGELNVMQSHYCLRRELGACLKTESANKLPHPLYLRSGAGTYRVDTDCANCCMHIVQMPAKQI